METASQLQWWRWGLIGGTVLGLMTVENVVVAVIVEPVVWRDVIVMPPALFVIGFVCGSLAGRLRGLSDWFGWAGDAAIGAAVGTVYFAACSVFDRDEASAGLMVVGGVIGAAIGILFGWDWRREASRQRGNAESGDAEDGGA